MAKGKVDRNDRHVGDPPRGKFNDGPKIWNSNDGKNQSSKQTGSGDFRSADGGPPPKR